MKTTLFLCVVCSMPVSASTLYGISGTSGRPLGIGGSVGTAVEYSWSSVSAYSNVTISEFFRNSGGTSVAVTAYLMTAVGSGATAGANQVASSVVNVAANSASTAYNLFAGVNLAANLSYYVVVTAPTQFSGLATAMTTNPSTITTAPDVTPSALWGEVTIGIGTLYAGYIPSSTFATFSTAGIAPQILVTGTASASASSFASAPEPATWAGLMAGLVALRRRVFRARLRRPGTAGSAPTC